MKRILLPSILLTVAGFYSNGQQFQNVFPTSDAIWNIQTTLGGSWKEHYYGLTGDTIINDTLYNKLYFLNDTTLTIDTDDKYAGGFRQEGKKVWFRPNLSFFNEYPEDYPEETLLYDFSKNVEDTIWHNIVFREWSCEMKDSITASIITSTDTDEHGNIIYHTEEYSVWEYDGISELEPMWITDRWMEGIGSLDHGLFWFLSLKTLSGEPQFRLACFKQGDKVIYANNQACDCFCYSTGIEQNSVHFEVVHENSYIHIKSEATAFPCTFKLFSLTGQLVLEKQLQFDENQLSFNQKGIWLYQIQKDKEIIKTGKLISQ
jgi:hypothetical protein